MINKQKAQDFVSNVLCTFIFFMCANTFAVALDEINVYSARKENLIKPLLDQFTQETGVKVNLVTGKADTLLYRLQSEGRNSPADLFITVDAGRLHRAREAGVLQTVQSKILTNAIPAHLRDPDGYWFALSKRARVVFYAKDRVDPEQLEDYSTLTEPTFKQKVCIRSSDNIYNQSLVASILAHTGEKATSNWLKQLVGNFARPPRGGDRDQIKGVAAGECDIAVGNTYYYGMMMTGNDKGQREAANKVSIFWPNQKGNGTHINVSGIGLTAAIDQKSVKTRALAIQLMEYLVSKEAQSWYAEANFEYPVREDVAPSKLLASWGTFKEDTLDLMALGRYNSAAVKLMDKADWK